MLIAHHDRAEHVRRLFDPSDEVMVRQTIQTYLHGLKFNDIESFKKAFYPDARLFFVQEIRTIGQLTQAEW